jgi:hypothetical protein
MTAALSGALAGLCKPRRRELLAEQHAGHPAMPILESMSKKTVNQNPRSARRFMNHRG